MHTAVYNVLKVAEGGPGQAASVVTAKRLGAKAVVPTTSIYIGQTAIIVTAGKRVHERLARALYR
jgi:hypothetical protein|tara:strand:- start:190 stop:384 length:195 start_codon:yes stop_codon:yes gene_type:complete